MTAHCYQGYVGDRAAPSGVSPIRAEIPHPLDAPAGWLAPLATVPGEPVAFGRGGDGGLAATHPLGHLAYVSVVCCCCLARLKARDEAMNQMMENTVQKIAPRTVKVLMSPLAI